MGAKSRGNFAHQPNPEWCCPGCIWPKEPHSDWCGKGKNSTGRPICGCRSARTVHASADGICCGRCGGAVK